MGRFLLGFVVGAAIGSVAVILLTPKSGSDTRESISSQVNRALEDGKQAAQAREQELWETYRAKLKAATSSNTAPKQYY